MSSDLTFFVVGKPQTAGSKTSVPITNKGGQVVGRRVLESGNRDAKADWRRDVRAEAERAITDADGWPHEGPCEVAFVFMRHRPKGHYGTGRNAGVLKATADRYPTTRPDALKLGRAVEDALTGILWKDDAAIVTERLEKRWGDREGVAVAVRRLA